MRFAFRLLSIIRNCSLAAGSIIYPFGIVTNSSVGDYTYVSYFSKINNAKIGKFCSIAQNSKMGLGRHPIDYISTNPILYSARSPLRETWVVRNSSFKEHLPVTIGNDVWIGSNVTILDGVTVGDGAIIGAHSLITKDVLPYSIVGGVPARLIKMRFDDEIISILGQLKWWDFPIGLLKRCSAMGLFSESVDKDLLSSISTFVENSNR